MTLTLTRALTLTLTLTLSLARMKKGELAALMADRNLPAVRADGKSLRVGEMREVLSRAGSSQSAAGSSAATPAPGACREERTYSQFVHKELVHFSLADNRRSLPSLIDGLKPSQRKVG